jgi:hypothetical protein
MLPENKKNTNIGVGVGLLLQFAGKVLMNQEGVLILPGFLAVLAGTAGIIWGCMNYAEGKGYPKWFGLLGLLSCFGLIVLILFPDHYKGAR